MTDLDELYAKARSVECKGLCWRNCSNIEVGDAERRRMVSKGIVPPELTDTPCRHLNQRTKRCRCHADRPLVCRLYGSIPAMRCPFGCEPTMTDAEGARLMQAVLAGGQELDRGHWEGLWERAAIKGALGR